SRDLGHIKFVVLADSTGEVQVTWKSDEGSQELGETLSSLRQNDVFMVSGRVRKSSIARSGLEISPTEVVVLTKARHPLPLDVTGEIEAGLDVRLDFRPLDLMRPQTRRIFRLYSDVLRHIREFLVGNGFVEVVSPKLIAQATEGGANLFSLDYFDTKAFLAQSPQLYKEQLTIGLERVFEIATFFRAEPFDTTRHLNEFVSMDLEAAFADHNDMMDLLEKMVMSVVQSILANEPTNKAVGKGWRNLSLPFPRYRYDEIFDRIVARGMHARYGEDLSSEHLKQIEGLSGLYFITDWPKKAKPFYIKVKEASDLTDSFDFMCDTLEVCSGGSREENLSRLRSRIIECGLDPDGFREHLKFFEIGMPPHAGWGLGFDRFMMALTGLQNIREVVLYPRDKARLIP
ncbi:aspartate--tRNA(Asn) ligase, partial [bacterium]